MLDYEIVSIKDYFKVLESSKLKKRIFKGYPKNYARNAKTKLLFLYKNNIIKTNNYFKAMELLKENY